MTAVDLLQGQVTQAQALEFMKGAILSAPSPPEQATLETPGTPENAFLYVLSIVEEGRSADRANYALAGYRSTAPIEWLRLHTIEFFGLPVQTAGYATTTIQYTNVSGNQYGPFSAGELRVAKDSTETLYENTEEVTIEAAQLFPLVPKIKSFGVRALDAGTVANAAIGEINRLESALEGVTVTNTQAAATVDDESADSINRRTDALIGIAGVPGVENLSAGAPETAPESIARNGRDKGGGCLRSDGTRVRVTRSKLIRDDATGISTLYVGDDDGPINLADLAFVANEVSFYAQWSTSRIVSTNVVLVSIVVNATMTIRNSKLTDSEIEAKANTAFVNAALAVPVGGFAITPSPGVPNKYIEGAIEGALAGLAQVVTIAVTVPSTTTLLTAGQVVQFFVPPGGFTITRIP